MMEINWVGLREARKFSEGSVVLIQHFKIKNMYEVDNWFRPDLLSPNKMPRKFALLIPEQGKELEEADEQN